MLESQPLIRPPAGEPRSRARSFVVGTLLVALLVSGGWARRAQPTAQDLRERKSAPSAPLQTAESSTSHRINVPMSDFLRFPKVVDHLVAKGVHDPLNANESTLLDYLPKRLTIDVDDDALRGDIGEDATGGYVAFNVYNGEAASWMVVMSTTGKLHQVSPGKSAGNVGEGHFCGFKNLDEQKMLLAAEANYTGSGHAYIWDWRKDTYERIGGDAIYSAHDIQWAVSRKDAFWIPWAIDTTSSKNAMLVDARTGEVYHTLQTTYGTAADVNHVQMLENDTLAVVSLRLANGIAKFNVTNSSSKGGELLWVVGGEYGTWPIRDFDRSVLHPPGSTLWSWQHNAEYIGEGEYAMFDNGGLGNESRMLIVSVNETAREAALEWEYRLGTYSMIFGDHDPVPTGNMQGAYWRTSFGNRTGDEQAHSGLVEVVRESKRVAWHMRVYGRDCPHDHCKNNIWNGWKFYSSERFFEAPLLPAASSSIAPRCKGGVLEFTAWNSFKQNHGAPGSFALTESATGRVLAAGDLRFAPFWRPTEVSRRVAVAAATAVELEVFNERGRSAKTSFMCTV